MHGIVLSFYVRDLIIHYQKYLKFFDELRVKKTNYFHQLDQKMHFQCHQGQEPYIQASLYPSFGKRPCTLLKTFELL